MLEADSKRRRLPTGKAIMKTTPANRRKRSNRRSGFDRRWITSAYSGPERRKGTDRRKGADRRRTRSRLVPLHKSLNDAPEQAPPALPAPVEASGEPEAEGESIENRGEPG